MFTGRGGIRAPLARLIVFLEEFGVLSPKIAIDNEIYRYSGLTCILMFSNPNPLATVALACTRCRLTENFQPMWTTGRNISSCGFASAYTHVHTSVNSPISMTELQSK